MADGFGDLAHLLLGDGQVAHGFFGIDLDVQLLEQLARLGVHRGVLDEQAPARLAADKDVLGDGQVAHHVQLLVNDDDAGRLGLAGVVEFHLAALVGDGAGVLGVDARQHLHQRGLARAVFAHQRVHLTLADFEIDVVQGVHTRERLIDALHGQYDFSHDASSVSSDFCQSQNQQSVQLTITPSSSHRSCQSFAPGQRNTWPLTSRLLRSRVAMVAISASVSFSVTDAARFAS